MHRNRPEVEWHSEVKVHHGQHPANNKRTPVQCGKTEGIVLEFALRKILQILGNAMSRRRLHYS